MPLILGRLSIRLIYSSGFKVGTPSAEEFQEFIDGPSGPGFGQDALMNICKPIDTALMNGQTPYPPVFS